MRLGRRRKKLEPGEYPASFTHGWLRLVLPSASPAEARSILEAMRRKGWTEEEVAERILPFMPPLPPTPEGGKADSGKAPAVAVPRHVSTRWLDTRLPPMDRRQIRLVVEELERRGWPPTDLAVAVLPHLLPKLPDEDADAILAGLEKLGLSEDEITRLTPTRSRP